MPSRIAGVAGYDLEAKPLIEKRRLEAVSVQHDLVTSAHDRLSLRGFDESFAVAMVAEVFADPQVTDFTGSTPGPAVKTCNNLCALVAQQKRYESSVDNLGGFDVVLIDLALKEVHIGVGRIFYWRYFDVH